MKMSDIDIYQLPIWLGMIVDEIQEKCRKELLKESPQFISMESESHEILEHFEFISTLIDRDKITEPMNIDVTEVKALSRFLALEEDMRELIQIKTYFMGCRHTIQFLILAGVL